MADSLLGGALGGIGDFFFGGGKYADPNAINPQYGVPEADVRQAGINTLANVSALLLAAGQPMSGQQRAQLLAGVGPALGGMQSDIFKASQARLMTAQQRTAMEEARGLADLTSKIKQNPEEIATLIGRPVEFVRNSSPTMIRDIMKTQASRDPLQQRLAQLQVGEAEREAQETEAINKQRQEDPAGLARSIGISEELVKTMDARTLRDVAKQVSIKRATTSPLQQAVQSRIGQIMGMPLPSSAPTGAAPAPSGAAPAPALAAPAGMGAPAAAPAEGAAPALADGRMTPSMARAIASDPIILAGNPELAKQYAEIAEKLETPGAREGQILRARSEAQRLENMPKVELSIANRQQQANLVKQTIDDALKETGFFTTGGVGRLAAALPGTPAYDLARRIETIKANIGFNELQRMRDESPTGGALGQVAVQELTYLQSALGNLDQAQSREELEKNLRNIRSIIERYERIRGNAFERDYGRRPDVDRLLRDPEAVEQRAQAAGAVPPPAPAGGQLRVDANAIEQARAAIARGAPREAVRQRLRERGFSDEGL